MNVLSSPLSMVNSECRSWFLMVPLLTIFTLLSCAQGRYGVEKISAFATEQIPGNIPVGPDGEPLALKKDTVYTIYVEMKSDDIVWDSAWVPGRAFSISQAVVPVLPFEAGIDKTTGEKIRLSPKEGNQSRVLYLQADETRKAPPKPVKTGHILLQGRKKGKLIYQETETILVLSVNPSV